MVDFMSSPVVTPQCDYLDPRTLSNVPTDVSEQLLHISHQISAIDSHVSQLITMRNGLRRRSHQLHNILLPIHTLPTEILSYIFQLVLNQGGLRPKGSSLYKQCLARALVLSSVSSHFRHIAFGTPELWRRVPLHLTRGQPVCKVSSLLQHCVTVASMVKISVSENLGKEDARSAIDVLLTPHVTRRIRTFELYESIYSLGLWVEKLRNSPFPMLGTLRLKISFLYFREDPIYNFGALKALTKLSLDSHRRKISRETLPITVPPTLRYLNLNRCSEEGLMFLLHQTPNLVECVASITESNTHTRNVAPLTLNHLRRLNLSARALTETRLLARDLRLPSLEILELTLHGRFELSMFIPFCRIISATVTTLTMNVWWSTLDSESLYQLCRLPFPKLRSLNFYSDIVESIICVFRALAPVDGGDGNSETCYLPALDSIIICYDDYDVEPKDLLNLLKRWKIGDAFDFHIQRYLEKGSIGDAFDHDTLPIKLMVQLLPLVTGTTRGVRISRRMS